MLGFLSNAIVGAIDVSKSEDAIKIDAQTATLVSSLLRNSAERYGNTGCGVFKGEIQNLTYFWLKINCSQMKLLYFENWSSGKLSKI